MLYQVFVVIFILSLPAVCALKLDLQKSSILNIGARKPSHAFRLSSEAFCFSAEGIDCTSSPCPKSLFCTSDSGDTFEEKVTTHPPCTNGIAVENKLVCPLKAFPEPEKGLLTYSTYSFSIPSSGGDVVTREDKKLVFRVDEDSLWPTNFLLNGNCIFASDNEIFLCVATGIAQNGRKRVYFFKSTDGYNYDLESTISKIEDAESHTLIYEGGRKISVISAFPNSKYLTSTSNYMGRWWAANRPLVIQAPPVSVIYPSGVLAQYSCSNTTSSQTVWYTTSNNVKTQIKGQPSILPAGAKEPLTITTLSQATASTKDLVVISETADAGSLSVSLYMVDDSQEEESKTKKILAEEERERVLESARTKARKDLLERTRREREEKKIKDFENKILFQKEDHENTIIAKSFMHIDGELIIVRRVSPDTVAFERDTFFADL